MTATTYIADLTVGEFTSLLKTTIAEAQQLQPRWVKGIPGIMEIYKCSYSTAKRIKASGAIDKAIHQQGRTLLVNATLALQLFGGKTSKHFNS